MLLPEVSQSSASVNSPDVCVSISVYPSDVCALSVGGAGWSVHFVSCNSLVGSV